MLINLPFRRRRASRRFPYINSIFVSVYSLYIGMYRGGTYVPIIRYVLHCLKCKYDLR